MQTMVEKPRESATADNQIPSSAFEMDAVRLSAWERHSPPDWLSFKVVRGRCVDKFGQVFAGYVDPLDLHATCYLSGWMAGRRSVNIRHDSRPERRK